MNIDVLRREIEELRAERAVLKADNECFEKTIEELVNQQLAMQSLINEMRQTISAIAPRIKLDTFA